jgi:hypothetical protein
VRRRLRFLEEQQYIRKHLQFWAAQSLANIVFGGISMFFLRLLEEQQYIRKHLQRTETILGEYCFWWYFDIFPFIQINVFLKL